MLQALSKRRKKKKVIAQDKEDKFDHKIVDSVKCKLEGGNIVLDFPLNTIEASELPTVLVVTVTRNRKQYFPLAIDNWRRIYYPQDKITWVVVDDSDDIEKEPKELLNDLNDLRIKYRHLPAKVDKGSIVPYSIGEKRNWAINNFEGDIIAVMDDDDFFYDNSILARICALKFYKKEHVYSNEVGVYHAVHMSSYVLEEFAGVPEGSSLFIREFWERNKYAESYAGEEGVQLVKGQESVSIKIPYFFNMIVINHNKNATGGGRNIRFRNTGMLKSRKSLQAPINFWKTAFTESFQKAMKTIF